MEGDGGRGLLLRGAGAAIALAAGAGTAIPRWGVGFGRWRVLGVWAWGPLVVWGRRVWEIFRWRSLDWGARSESFGAEKSGCEEVCNDHGRYGGGSI